MLSTISKNVNIDDRWLRPPRLLTEFEDFYEKMFVNVRQIS